MSGRASVEGRERLRLFAALVLPDGIADALAEWQEHAFADGRGARLVPRGNMHVTLAFLGGRPAHDVEPVLGVLREAARVARRPLLAPARYRETRSVGMLVFEDEGAAAAAFAAAVGERLERLGLYEREQRPWLPHVTVVRFRSRPRLSPPLPALRPFSLSEAALYHSVLRPGGPQYEILESVALGG